MCGIGWNKCFWLCDPGSDENLVLWEELKMVSLFTRRWEDQREAGRFGGPGKLLYPRIKREVQRSS